MTLTIAASAAPRGPSTAPPRRRRRWVPYAVVAGYLVVALAAYWPLWPGDPSRLPQCACGDAVQGSWFLGWLPWALGHLHNPFFTRILDHPSGVNLAQNTEMPLLGLLTAPLTVAANPVASFNLVLWLAYPLSATSLYLVSRRFLRSELAACLAGLLYGFSAYVVGEGFGHPNLSFVPLPPLILALCYELLVAQRRSAARVGLALGGAIAAQFLISPEILSTTAIVALVGTVLLASANRAAWTRARLRHALGGLLAAALLAGAVLAYPMWFQLAGPGRFHGAVQAPGNPYRADLLGPVVPTPAERLAPAGLRAFGGRLTGGDVAENGSYLGIALLAACAALVAHLRRNRWLVAAAVMAVACFVLSLGSSLVVAGHRTGVPLPFAAIARVPVLRNILPSRLALYQDGFVALVAAGGLDEILARRRAGRAGGPGSSRRRWGRDAGLAAVGLACLAPLVPAWPVATAPAAVPRLFATGARPLAARSVVLTFPFPVSPDDQAMLWQAFAGYRFDLVGGYALVPGPRGRVSSQPPQRRPFPVQLALGYEAAGVDGYLRSKRPELGPSLVEAVRRYLAANGVDAVVVDPSLGEHPETVTALFRAAIGRPPRSVGGVLLWRVSPDGPPAGGRRHRR